MKKAFSVLLVFLMIALLIGCKEKEKEEKFTPSLDKEISGELTIAGHYDNFEALEEEFNRFLEYYPNVKLKYEKLDNYNKIIATTLLSDTAPDIYFTQSAWLNSDSYNAVFEKAEDLSDASLKINLSCIRDGLLAKDRYGKTSLVPIYTTTYGMMVNEDIFKKEGLSIPKTYEELVNVSLQLKEKGYANPVMGYNNETTSMLYSLFFPYFCGSIANNAQTIQDLNQMKEGAGEYMRSTLNLISDFMSKNIVNLESCNELANDYNAVIMRFFEGDIPMMFSSVNTVSGTKKRETQSEAFIANPFKYSFHPVPSTQSGGYFLNTISIGFSVNKDSENLDIANEFMRFLVSTSELNAMAQNKRMVTPCKNMALDEVYSSFDEIKEDSIIYMYTLGLADTPDVQVRRAGAQVTNGTMTVDEAIAEFGNFK